MGLLGRKPSAEEGKKLTKEITILNRLGLHARPAAMFVKVCNRHKSDIWIEKDGEQVNGKRCRARQRFPMAVLSIPRLRV